MRRGRGKAANNFWFSNRDTTEIPRACARLTKAVPHALSAFRSDPAAARESRRKCTDIAAIPAAHCEQATSAARCAFPAGAIASATMAACCSSICAITMASPKWWPIPTARRSRSPRRCARNGSCASTARCARRPAGTENAELPTGAVEVYIREIEVLGRAGELPMPVFGDQEYPEETRLKYRFLDLRREHLHQNIMKRGAVIDFDQTADEGAGLLRVPDADFDRVLARRRARLSRALAHPSGKILRAAAGAAAVQAADHDLRLRPVFSDRALLSRRGRARRPLARRVLSARHRNELRHPGGCFRGGRAGACAACSRNFLAASR